MLTGIIRSVDDLGRIVIPSEWRKELGLNPGTQLEISRKGDILHINKISEHNAGTGTGIIRSLDALGRLVLPKEWRQDLGFYESVALEMCKNGNKLTISIKQEVCCICGFKKDEEDVTLRVHGKIVCKECREKIAG